MGITIYQVDAFTDTPFSGNPAAVCILPEAAEEEWMQKVAREMNLSETAFLFGEEDGYRLRWFTPTEEEDLCGHATLASAHILWEENLLQQDEEAKFLTRSGILRAKQKDGWIELNFPDEAGQETSPPDGLIEALGVHPIYIGQNRLDYLVEVDSEHIVREMKPNRHLLERMDARGVIVTAKSASPRFDFISRFFAVIGGDEDPVTGSAHCYLGPYWQGKTGKKELTAYQASERGGVIHVRMANQRVYLSGQARTVLKGTLFGE
jgi:PhzF family phenazine biosynthesis protein